MRPRPDVTVLWALRSPCNLGCDYCYFGTLEDDREAPPIPLGQLSHLPHGDLTLAFDRCEERYAGTAPVVKRLLKRLNRFGVREYTRCTEITGNWTIVRDGTIPYDNMAIEIL